MTEPLPSTPVQSDAVSSYLDLESTFHPSSEILQKVKCFPMCLELPHRPNSTAHGYTFTNRPSCLVTHVSYFTRILCFWSSKTGVQHASLSYVSSKKSISLHSLSWQRLPLYYLASDLQVYNSSPASLQSIDREAWCTILRFIKGISPLIS